MWRRSLFEMSRRDDAIVACHGVPGRVPPQKIRPAGCGVILAGVRTNRSRTSCARSYRTLRGGSLEDAFPGTSCQATIGVSRRDGIETLATASGAREQFRNTLRRTKKHPKLPLFSSVRPFWVKIPSGCFDRRSTCAPPRLLPIHDRRMILTDFLACRTVHRDQSQSPQAKLRSSVFRTRTRCRRKRKMEFERRSRIGGGFDRE
jgi:hypothetical protein